MLILLSIFGFAIVVAVMFEDSMQKYEKKSTKGQEERRKDGD